MNAGHLARDCPRFYPSCAIIIVEKDRRGTERSSVDRNASLVLFRREARFFFEVRRGARTRAVAELVGYHRCPTNNPPSVYAGIVEAKFNSIQFSGSTPGTFERQKACRWDRGFCTSDAQRWNSRLDENGNSRAARLQVVQDGQESDFTVELSPLASKR